MRIADLLDNQLPALSFEFYPPRSDIGFWDLYRTVEALKPLDPTYVSVTYGAGGSTRRKTVDLVARIKQDIGIESLAHLTCYGASREELVTTIDEIKQRGIENVLALRGDPPKEAAAGGPGCFSRAHELVSFIRDRADVCIGAACHPEGHPECPDFERGLEHLKQKVDAGADFLISQLFFDNEDFLRFRDAASMRGIHVPIVAGMMPILSVKQIKRFTQMCGARIPEDLLHKIEAVEDDSEAVRHIGMYHATRQCLTLLEEGVAGIHFYTLNRSTATRAIYQHIRADIESRRGAANGETAGVPARS